MSQTALRRRKPVAGGYDHQCAPAPSVAVSSVSDDSTSETPSNATSEGSVKRWALIFVRLLIGAAVLGALGVVFIIIGAEGENEAIEEAKSSLSLYTEDRRVCAGTGTADDVRGPFATFPSVDDARSVGKDDVVIAHCGGCGKCSTVPDMTIMARTTQTLTDAATWCSTRGLIGSAFLWRGLHVYRRIAAECMRSSVGFTPDCQECWMDDMVCSIQKCVFTCVKSVYLLREPKNGMDGRLSTCLECDEKICGPDFLTCSGANRRRQGIQSDIGRDDDKELCWAVDVDWTRVAA